MQNNLSNQNLRAESWLNESGHEPDEPNKEAEYFEALETQRKILARLNAARLPFIYASCKGANLSAKELRQARYEVAKWQTRYQEQCNFIEVLERKLFT